MLYGLKKNHISRQDDLVGHNTLCRLMYPCAHLNLQSGYNAEQKEDSLKSDQDPCRETRHLLRRSFGRIVFTYKTSLDKETRGGASLSSQKRNASKHRRVWNEERTQRQGL